jgi:hypothetical protein
MPFGRNIKERFRAGNEHAGHETARSNDARCEPRRTFPRSDGHILSRGVTSPARDCEHKQARQNHGLLTEHLV